MLNQIRKFFDKRKEQFRMNNILTGHGENVTTKLFRESFKGGMTFSCGNEAARAGYSEKPIEKSEYAAWCNGTNALNVARDNSASR